jgi:hypothetical protein
MKRCVKAMPYMMETSTRWIMSRWYFAGRCATLSLLVLLALPLQTRADTPRVPVTYVDRDPIITIDTWRITGPVFLPQKDASGTRIDWSDPTNQMRALQGAFPVLNPAVDGALQLKSPTTAVPINFDHDDANFLGARPNGSPFLDQFVKFPAGIVSSGQIYWGFPRLFSITYATVGLQSVLGEDCFLIIQSNSPLDASLNGSEVGRTSLGDVGHNPSDYRIIHVHLKRGLNLLRLKMFTFPGRNGFSARVASRDGLRHYLDENVSLVDLLNHIIVKPGDPLELSSNFAAIQNLEMAKMSVICHGPGHWEHSAVVASVDQPFYLRLAGDGLYTMEVKIGHRNYRQAFFVGDAKSFVDAERKKGCTAIAREHEADCAALEALQRMLAYPYATTRLDGEKHILQMLMGCSMVLESLTGGDRAAEYLPPHFIIEQTDDTDGSGEHFYYIYAPRRTRQKDLLTAAVVCPWDYGDDPFYSYPTSQVVEMDRYLSYAHRYGIALILPFDAGHWLDDQDALQATEKVIAAAEKKYAVNPAGLVLFGDCAGGRIALLFAEHHPDAVRSIATLNAATSSDDEIDGESMNALGGQLRRLQNIPILLIHGDFYPHSPTSQATEALVAMQRNNVFPNILIVPGNGTLGEVDPVWRAFHFFSEVLRSPTL